MIFLTPAFVRVNDSEKRKELTEWLQGIGYMVCRCCLFDGWNTLHCGAINRNRIDYEVHGIPDYDGDTGYNVGWFKAENADKEYPSYDCGEDIELFKALAAMNDGNDREQWFIDELGHFEKCRVKEANIVGWIMLYGKTPRKASAEEIIEHFKKREK